MMILTSNKPPMVINPISISRIMVDVVQEPQTKNIIGIDIVFFLSANNVIVRKTPEEFGNKKFIQLVQKVLDPKESEKIKQRLVDVWKMMFTIDGTYDINELANYILLGDEAGSTIKKL